MAIKPYILCGGSGSRLWPLSRSDYPKQWLDIFNNKKCLFDSALDFAVSKKEYVSPGVIANIEHRFLIAESIKHNSISNCDIILEANGRNTAAAIAIAALQSEHSDTHDLVLVMASDNLIGKPDALHEAIKNVAPFVRQGNIGIFGIKPTEPHTGYGYIKLPSNKQKRENNISRIASFTEKPDLETAQEYLENGNYFWNASIFLFRPCDMLDALEKHASDILDKTRLAWQKKVVDADFIRLDAQSYETIRSQSIDYAVMEKIDNIICAVCEPDWKDMGDWQAVWKHNNKDENGNAIIGNALVCDSSDLLICSDKNILTTAYGVNNLAIVTTKDAVLVIDKNKSQKIKNLIEIIGAKNENLLKHHCRCYRPWGWYETLILRDGFQVKRIMVKSGAKLSLQSHKHRCEHWIVVSGIADVTLGDVTLGDVTLGDVTLGDISLGLQMKQLKVDENIYIPALTKHRLGNSSQKELYIIEVQTGKYLGEDDITRYEDIYDRLAVKEKN